MNKIINDFTDHFRNNVFLIVWTCVIGLITYGAHIFNYTIGIDSDVCMENPNNMLFWHVQEGRFGITFFHKLFCREEGLNIYALNICAFIILIFSCLLWCWLIEKYSKKSNQVGLLLFSTFYVTSVVWMEINYFTYMSVACMVGVALMPIAVVFAWEGFRKKRKKLVLLALIFLVIGISMYQLLVALFFSGMLVVYCLEFENDKIEKENQYRYLFSIAMFILAGLILYFGVNCFVLRCFNTEIDGYVISKLQQGSIRTKMQFLVILICSIITGENNIFDSHMENYWGIDIYAWRGSLIFLFAFIIYICRNWTNRRRNTFAYYLATFMMFLSVISPAILSNGSASDRYLHALPLVSGYIVYCMIGSMKEWKKPLMILGYSLSVIFAFRQMWSNSMLMQSNLMRYQYDVRLCNNVNKDILAVWNDNGLEYETATSEMDVAIMGEYPFDYGDNYEHSEIIAVSFGARMFEIESTFRMVPFMKALGYKYDGIDADDERLDSVRAHAVNMPAYPNEGYIELYDGVTIVKLSNLVYQEY